MNPGAAPNTDRTNMDRIEKSILLRAPRARVWKALADADAFGQWFGIKLNGAFVELKELRELTSDANGAQRVAWTDTWLRARAWFESKLAGLPVRSSSPVTSSRPATVVPP